MRKLLLIFLLAIAACKKHASVFQHPTNGERVWGLVKGNDAWTNNQLFILPDTSQGEADFSLSLLASFRYYQQWNRTVLDSGTYDMTGSVLHLSSDVTFGKQSFFYRATGNSIYLTDSVYTGEFLTYTIPVDEY